MLRAIGMFLIATVIASVGCAGTSSSRSRITSPPPSDPPPGSTDVQISIFPSSDTLRIGGQRQFSGFDRTVGQYDVTWSVQEGAAGGSISAGGLYTAPTAAGTFHLVATSNANPKLSATAPVAVVSVGFVPSKAMAVARSGHTATLLQDGRVLIAGGTTDGTHGAELFVPASSSFTSTTGAMIHVRGGHCAALLQDGRVLIAGGDDGHGTLFATAELFNPATQSFVATGSLNHARTAATATLLQNGKVLIVGGQDNAGTLLSSAELYDPTTGTFILTGSMQSPRAQHTATLLADGRVLLVGSNHDTSSAELFDPTSGVFTATGSLGQARTHHTATLLPNGKVLVLGGTQRMPPGGGGAPAAPVSLGTAELYDPPSGRFQLAGKLLMARDSHSATVLADGTVLVAGGYLHDFDGDAQPEWYTIFTAELFDPATSTSTAAASLEGDRAEHVATLLQNGQILVSGGKSGYQVLCCSPTPYVGLLSSAEVYK
jgi:WD40 repeat protein